MQLGMGTKPMIFMIRFLFKGYLIFHLICFGDPDIQKNYEYLRIFTDISSTLINTSKCRKKLFKFVFKNIYFI